jgi:hypothetical protein
MSPSQEYSYTLKERQQAYLVEMAKKHRLEDVSKALRCLIDFAIDSPEAEAAIFQEIRCLDC